MSSDKFYASLKKGDLAFADNLAVKVLHIIRLEHTAYDDDVSDLPRTLTKAAREKKLAEIEPRRKRQWHASAICGVRGEHSFYGNYSRYYWSPREAPSLHLVCKACLKAWRKLGEPEIASYDRSAKQEEPWPWPLPFGWVETALEGHPYDVPPDQDPELVKDKTGEVVGKQRVEIRRFQRGRRVVRLVHYYKDDAYQARTWGVNKRDVNADTWHVSGSLAQARVECQKLMAKGGE